MSGDTPARETSEVRIRRRDGETAGVGVLIADTEVLTCAHVINSALLGSDNLRSQDPPSGEQEVIIEFLNLPGLPIRIGKVEAWLPPSEQDGRFDGDVAGLRLNEPAPVAALRATFAKTPAEHGARLRVFGFPTGEDYREHGLHVLVEVKGQLGPVQQIDTVSTEAIPAQPGFSGAPVWDDDAQLVTGLLTGTAFLDQRGRDAYLIPPDTVASAWEDALGYIKRRDNPYRGLQPFTESDAEQFFGREAEAERLAQLLLEHGTVTVIGPSGVGKSSLVRAGLVAELDRLQLDDVDSWTVVIFRPGTDPWMSLARELTLVTDSQGRALTEGVGATEQRLHVDGITPIARELAADRRPLLLIADQFEELFTNPARPPDPALLNLLVPPVEAPLTKIVITIRTDVRDAWSDGTGRVPLPPQSVFEVLPLGAEQRRRAVEEPAKANGVAFEPGLISKIVQQTTDDSLPLLQFVLSALWTTQRKATLTHERYDELGGVTGFLDQFAEEQAARLRLESADVLDETLLRLVTAGRSTNNTRLLMRARVPKSTTRPKQWQVLEQLARARLVNIVTTVGEEPAAELAHERLITAWRRLHELSEAHADFLDWLGWINGRAALDDDPLSEGGIAEARKWLEQAPSAIPVKIKQFVARSEAVIAERVSKLEAALNDARAFRLAADAELVLRSTRVRTTIALALAIESLLVKPTAQGYGALRRALSAHRPTIAELQHARPVWKLALSPDRATIATASGDGLLRLFDVETGAEKRRFQHGHEVVHLAFSGDGSRLATASVDRSTRVFDASALGIPVAEFQHDRPVTSVALSFDGQRVASGGRDNRCAVLDIPTGTLHSLEHGGVVNAVAFAPDGDLLMTACQDGMARLFDAGSGSLLNTVAHGQPVRDVAVSPDGRYAATAGEDGLACVLDLLDLAAQQIVHRLEHEGPVLAVAFDCDGKTLATASMDGAARVYDVVSGALECRLPCEFPVRSLSFGGTSTRLATGCDDGSVRVHDTETGRVLIRFDHEAAVLSVAMDFDGARLAVATADNRTVLYGTEPVGAESQRLDHATAVSSVSIRADGWIAVAEYSGRAALFNPVDQVWSPPLTHDAPVTGLSMSCDGLLLATACEDGLVRLWRTAEPLENPRLISSHHGPVLAVSLSADGSLVATGGLDCRVKVVSTDDHRTVLQYAHRGAVRAVAMHGGSGLVVSGGADQQLICSDLQTQRPVRVFSCPAAITSVHISADARLVACGAEDSAARIFDVGTGRLVARLEHDARVSCVSFAPDGMRVASGSDDHTACLFETATGELLSQFEFDGPVTGVSFSADGATLAVSSVDGSVRLFETGCAPLVERAIAALPRPLTRDELRRFGAQDDIRHVSKWNDRTLRESRTTP
ncbi:MAG: hypothetical protein JWN95_2040 [Frankiales bacterium]|nr:hypothetical protein [Frankiales bacterium]